MRQKVERITKNLTERISLWDCAEAITLADSAEFDLYDPYFFLSLDIYHKGDLPQVEKRLLDYGDAVAFETSHKAMKDRFLIENLPVRIEFKEIKRIEEILSSLQERKYPFRQTGTYMFYRMKVGKILWERSGWLESIQKELQNLPAFFWRNLYEINLATLEHYLSDLGAAVFKNDPFFYTLSLAGFVRIFSGLIFILNRQFEPSGRRVFDTINNLPLLPENFKGRFESLVMEDPEITPSRKRELAELLTKSMILLGRGAFDG